MSTTMSAEIAAFIDTTRIFDILLKTDRKRISQRATVAQLKDTCNAIISLICVPACLADSVGAMKRAHARFLVLSFKWEKAPLQAVLYHVISDVVDAVDGVDPAADAFAVVPITSEELVHAASASVFGLTDAFAFVPRY